MAADTRAYVIETADPASNGSYTKVIPGLCEFKTTRSGNSTPSAIELVVAAVEDEDNAPLKRFYPFLKIRVFTADESILVFAGKIDQAELIENPTHGRVWNIKARDNLALLADNYIDQGVEGGWTPNYVGDFSDYTMNIVRDLALNVINDSSRGISTVTFSHPPNSKPIEINFDWQAHTTILDGIRRLAATDPWGPGGEVDALDLANAGFPNGSGFGAEFQIRYGQGLSGETVAEYYQRGFVFPGNVIYRYGEPNPLDTSPIIGYNFDKEGTDIYSRTRISGKGEGIYREELPGGGTGVRLADMEDTWDPENGLFKIRRESPQRFEAGVGDWTRINQGEEDEVIRARDLYNAAYAQLRSGVGGLAKYRGINRGTITIPGLPVFSIAPIRPGDLVRVVIPPIGLTDSVQADFLVERWTYSYPEDTTILEVSRHAPADLIEQLIGGLKKENDSQAQHNDHYDSDWRVVDGSGALTLQHNLGVRPRNVMVSAAVFLGRTNGSHKIPEQHTEVRVQELHFDVAQGQYVGFTVVEEDQINITVKFARWLSYSDGAGRWLRNNQGDVMVRVVLTP